MLDGDSRRQWTLSLLSFNRKLLSPVLQCDGERYVTVQFRSTEHKLFSVLMHIYELRLLVGRGQEVVMGGLSSCTADY